MNRLYVLLLLLFTTTLLSAQTDRRTLLDRNGERMRGTALALGRNQALPRTREAVRDRAWWAGVKDLELNTVRLCWVDPWYDTRPFGPVWTVEEVLPWIDDAVANATAEGLNLIINYHNINEFGEHRGFGRMTEFWTAVAPRYADNDLVYYELNNEQNFNTQDYYNDTYRDTMQAVYELVREAAPERHIIAFSFHSLTHPMHIIVPQTNYIDWDYTTVAFHFYGGTDLDRQERNLDRALGQFPLICTEWDVRQNLDYVQRYYGRDIMAQNLEEFGISWTDWRDWGDATNDQMTDIIIPHAKANGYWWGEGVSSVDERLATRLAVFPNPVGDVLNVRPAEGMTGTLTLRIVDMSGREVLRRQDVAADAGVRVDVSSLPRGSYSVVLEGAAFWGVARVVR